MSTQIRPRTIHFVHIQKDGQAPEYRNADDYGRDTATSIFDGEIGCKILDVIEVDPIAGECTDISRKIAKRVADLITARRRADDFYGHAYSEVVDFVNTYECDDIIAELEAAERDYRSMQLQGVA